jgi:hypothetical protein
MTRGQVASRWVYGWPRATHDGLLVLDVVRRCSGGTLPCSPERARVILLILGATPVHISWFGGRARVPFRLTRSIRRRMLQN